MAFYVLVLREQEEDCCVTYRFGPNEETLGRLRLDRVSGAVTQLQPVPVENSDALFSRAAAKVRQHWRERVFPLKSVWAS